MTDFGTFRRFWNRLSTADKVKIFKHHSSDYGDIQIKPATIENIISCWNISSVYEMYQAMKDQEITPDQEWLIRYGYDEKWQLTTSENLEKELYTYYIEEIFQDRKCWIDSFSSSKYYVTHFADAVDVEDRFGFYEEIIIGTKIYHVMK